MKAPEQSTPYSVSMGSREDLHLLIVKTHLESRLHRRLKIVPERSGEGPTHDIETDDDLRPSIVAEVKEIVPSEFLAVKNQVGHRSPKIVRCQSFRTAPVRSYMTCLTFVYSSNEYALMSFPKPLAL